MIEKINKIREKIKSNHLVGLGFTNINDFKDVVKFLLENKYYWNGLPDGIDLSDVIYNHIGNHNVFSIHINFYGNSRLTYTTSTTYYYESNILLNKSNIDFFKENLFIVKPNYRPRKKIIRDLS